MSLQLWAPLRARGLRCALTTLVLLLARDAAAHVTLDSPNGGESYTAGQAVTIRWRPDPPHDTLNWDLWYSTQGDDPDSGGLWTPIATDLPVNEADATAPLAYDWVTPDLDAPEVWVRVRQDNDLDPDYDDVSDASFSILAGPLGDLNGDGSTDAADYAVGRDRGLSPERIQAWRAGFGGSRPRVVGAAAAPEPAGLAQLLAGAASAACLTFGRRRR